MAGKILVRLTVGAMLGWLLAGCTDIGGFSLESDDQIAQPGMTIRVVTRISRRGLSRWFPPGSLPPVRVYRGNVLIAEHAADGHTWRFETETSLETCGEHPIDSKFRPQPDQVPAQATCYAFCWDASRPAVVVDFDRVVNHVTRLERLATDSPLGRPRDEAPAVLSALAATFYVGYLTELPPEHKQAIRDWLRKHDLPAGPIIHWTRRQGHRLQTGNMSATLARLQQAVPTVLIGIGEGADDLDAFANNRMLPVLIEFGEPVRDRPDLPRCQDWQDVWRFFQFPENAAILADPVQMLDLHHRGGRYLRTESPP